MQETTRQAKIIFSEGNRTVALWGEIQDERPDSYLFLGENKKLYTIFKHSIHVIKENSK